MKSMIALLLFGLVQCSIRVAERTIHSRDVAPEDRTFCRPKSAGTEKENTVRKEQINLYKNWGKRSKAYDYMFKDFWHKVRTHVVSATSDPVVLFDIGMNMGKWAVRMMETFPEMEYYGFEPFNSTVGMATRRITHYCQRNNKNVSRMHFLNLAVSNETAVKPLYQGLGADKPGSEHFSLHQIRTDKITRHKTVEDVRASHYLPMVKNVVGYINTTTIDDFVKKNGITKIDILKMDTEGNEPLVFRGAEYTLQVIHPPIIFFECHRFWRDNYDLGYSIRYMTKLLRMYGYDFFSMKIPELLFMDDPFYDATFETRLGWRNCLGVAHNAPNREKLLSKAFGEPYMRDEFLPYLIQPDSPKCHGEKAVMPGEPRIEDDPLYTEAAYEQTKNGIFKKES